MLNGTRIRITVDDVGLLADLTGDEITGTASKGDEGVYLGAIEPGKTGGERDWHWVCVSDKYAPVRSSMFEQA